MKKILLGIGYWILQLTWGFLMTFVGLVVTLFILIFMRKKARFHRNGFSWIIEIGGNWGGLELGAMALCGNYSITNKYWYQHTRRHEFGHTIQNIIFGPFYLFVVGIPSAIRYWYQHFEQKKGRYFAPNWYDCYAWFEYLASSWGSKAINYLEDDVLIYEYEGQYKGFFSRKKK